MRACQSYVQEKTTVRVSDMSCPLTVQTVEAGRCVAEASLNKVYFSFIHFQSGPGWVVSLVVGLIFQFLLPGRMLSLEPVTACHLLSHVESCVGI